MVVTAIAKTTTTTLVQQQRWGGGYRNATTAHALKVSSSMWRFFSSSAASHDMNDTSTSAETSTNSKIRNIGISAHIDRYVRPSNDKFIHSLHRHSNLLLRFQNEYIRETVVKQH